MEFDHNWIGLPGIRVVVTGNRTSERDVRAQPPCAGGIMRASVARYRFHKETSVASQAGIVWHRKLLSEVKEVKVLRSGCRVCYGSHKRVQVFQTGKAQSFAELPTQNSMT